MANFRVGQRVRVTGGRRDTGNIGREATITRHISGDDYVVAIDGSPAPAGAYGGNWHIIAAHMSPLTDPRACQFIEDMERFARVVNVPLVQIP